MPLFYLLTAFTVMTVEAQAEPPAHKTLKVVRTDDFDVSGDGSAAAWNKAAWEPLVPRGEKKRDQQQCQTSHLDTSTSSRRRATWHGPEPDSP